MTRIIAGFAGSLRIAVPGFGTRPTSDRVREAIFSRLDSLDAIEGARVVDLYAGSGALGLEAASRGASHITLVDRVAAAAALCRSNAALVLGQAPRDARPTIEVSGQPVQAFLNSSVATWDLAFLDPPYDLGLPELVHNLEALVPRLAPDAIVLLERGSRTPAPAWPDGLVLDRRKDYGDTALYWLEPA
jgi:16S rRNA (guanine966-N2)-methyltransferase